MTNPTSNFGWQMPTSTDLVTDLPADFETFGQAVDTSLADLKGGTTGQILAKASNTNMDFTWITNDVGDITAVTAGTGISGGGTSGAVTITNSMATEIAAKGDLIAGTGSQTFDNISVGTNGQVLTADSTTATGLAWATPAASSFAGVRVRNDGDLTISNTTATAVGFNVETFDSDGFHDNSTNNSRLTIPTGKTGYYQISALIRWKNISAANTVRQLRFYKNGTQQVVYTLQWVQNDDAYQVYSDLQSLSAGDYIEIYVWHNAGSSSQVLVDSSFAIVKVG